MCSLYYYTVLQHRSNILGVSAGILKSRYIILELHKPLA